MQKIRKMLWHGPSVPIEMSPENEAFIWNMQQAPELENVQELKRETSSVVEKNAYNIFLSVRSIGSVVYWNKL